MSLGLWLHPANLADCGRAFLARVDRARNGHTRLAGDAAAIIEALSLIHISEPTRPY